MILFLFVLISSFYFTFSESSSYDDDNREPCLTEMDFSNIKDRIVGGSDADKNSFPFAAGLIISASFSGQVRTDQASCAGTLITERHVMTASHCLYGKEHRRSIMKVNVGDYDTYVPDEVQNYIRGVKSIHMHPRYVDSTFDNDICILELDEPLPLDRSSNLRAAILPPQDFDLSPGTSCTVWGWGRKSYEGKKSRILQQVDVPITSREECQKHLTHDITPNMICAGGEEGKDACLGDSGGSLLVQLGNCNVCFGIVSFGKKCAMANVSGVYTRVSTYTDWIYEMTRNADCKPRIYPKENYSH